MRRVFVLMLAVGMMMAVAVPGSAAQPEVFVEEDFDETPYVVDVGCGFPLMVQDTGSMVGKRFFDKQGRTIREVYHANGTSYAWRESGDVVASDRWAGKVVFDYDPETGDLIRVTDTGNGFNVHAGAGGVLVNDSGRVVYGPDFEPIIVSGPHQGLFGEFDDLCEALA